MRNAFRTAMPTGHDGDLENASAAKIPMSANEVRFGSKADIAAHQQ